MSKNNQSRTLRVDYLARVEGEGGLHLKLKRGQVSDVKLRIFEPPRFFESFLRGRRFTEAPDLTARICGICPVAHQMSSVHAMEEACGVKVEGPLRALRRLLYCGEWIESHVLHIFLLHAPDFLGYASAIHLAKDEPALVQRALEMKKIGNQLCAAVGGREIHPINVRVGGFYKVPGREELEPFVEKLKRARDEAMEATRLLGKLHFPEFEQDYEFVALHHPEEYALNEGRLVSNKGLNIPVRDYESYFLEEHVPHSNALHSVLKARSNYLVGPLARYHLNFEQLSPVARECAQQAGLDKNCRNPFKSIIVRGVETVYACDEAIRIIEQYEPPERPFLEMRPRAATGWACTEAPRGVLYHRYRIDYQGLITDARIIPPTAQNQKTIESDLRAFVPGILHLPEEKLIWQCEQAVRNYDPCISCATHALQVRLERE